MGTLALKQGSRRFEDGIWRVRDIDLAVFLGIAQLRNIRARIKRDLAALEEFGEVKRTAVVRLGGEAEEFWLNRKQAYFTVARGETKQADELLIVLVDTFDAFERGELVAKEPTGQMIVLDREKNEIANRFAQLENKTARIEGTVIRMEGKLDLVDVKLDTLHSKTDQVLECQQHRRKEVTFKDEMKHESCALHRWAGYCPCCHVVRIIELDGRRTIEFQIDHYFGRHLAELKQTWPVCRVCNQRLRDSEYHQAHQSDFVAYQNTLAAFRDGPLFQDQIL
jgi:hypothetical protein